MVRAVIQDCEIEDSRSHTVLRDSNVSALEIGSYMTTLEYRSPREGYVVLGLTTTGTDCWSDLISKISLLIITPGSETQTCTIDVDLHGQHDEMSEPADKAPIIQSNSGIPISEALLTFREAINEYYLVGNNILNIHRAFLIEAARRHRRSVDEAYRVIDEVDDLPIRRFIDIGDLHKGQISGLTPEHGEPIADYGRRCRAFITNMNNVEISDICKRLELTQTELESKNPADNMETEKLVFETFLRLFD